MTRKLQDGAINVFSADNGFTPPAEGGNGIDAPTETANPFDVKRLRERQDFTELSGVEKVFTISVQKPPKQSFFRVHPDPEYRIVWGLIPFKEDDEFYWVAEEMETVLSADAALYTIFLATTAQKVPFLWPVRMQGKDGKTNKWHKSAMSAANVAMGTWIRIVANMSPGVGAYDTYKTRTKLADPVWPDQDFGILLKLAFGDRVIDSVDHDIAKRLLEGST
jgi:hypothetical protein